MKLTRELSNDLDNINNKSNNNFLVNDKNINKLI